MKNNVMCVNCKKVHELESEEQTEFICPSCGTKNLSSYARKTYELELGKIFSNADKYYSEAYSYEEANNLYKNLLEFEPQSLRAFTGVCLSLLRMSNIKKSYFREVANMIENRDLELSNSTYVRLGRFLEQCFISCFIYIRRVYKIYFKSEDLIEKVAICRDFWDIKYLFRILKDCKNVFSQEELNESFAVEESEIAIFEGYLNKVLGEEKNIKIDGESFTLYINNDVISYESISDDTFSTLSDEKIFIVNDYSKRVFIIFGLLIFFVLMMIAGLVLVISNFIYVGYPLVGAGVAGFAISYLYYKKKRDKFMEESNKY